MKKSWENTAILTKLSISTFSATKFDRKVTADTNARYEAGKHAGRYNKALIAREHCEAYRKLAGEARAWWYNETLPWTDMGWRILPAKKINEVTERTAEFSRAFEGVVHRFIENFDQYVEEAKEVGGRMFNEGDYPSKSTLLEAFEFDFTFRPIPKGDDFRCEIPESLMRDVDSRVMSAQADAIKDVYARITDVLISVTDLPDKKRTSDSVITNIQKLVELIPTFNLDNDPQLEAIRERLKNGLCKIDPGIFHAPKQADKSQAEVAKGDAANEANDILSTMAGFTG